jgi:AcrR family transcriptional regulator
MTDIAGAADVALRARPTQPRSVATFNAILDAAARVLEERGFGALTTNAVADEAGVTVRAIYRYFPNKHGLVAELAQRMSDHWAAALADPLPPTGTPLAERWPIYLEKFVNAVEATPGGRAVLLAMRGDPLLARIDEATNQRYISDVANELCRTAPHVDRADATAVATVVLRSTVAVVDEFFTRSDRGERARLLATLTRMHVGLLDEVCSASGFDPGTSS